jgi:hypothetical protein
MFLKRPCLTPSVSTFAEEDGFEKYVNLGGMELETKPFIPLQNVGAELTYVKEG